MEYKSTSVIILAIESSCDETAAAVLKDGKILANCIATQEIHKKYGGVIPELASRDHQKNILPVVNEALVESDISLSSVSAIAFTQGPGLLGALMVGSAFAKSLSWALNVPLLGVNHLEAHIAAHFIPKHKPEFPFLCLLVSGGHTQIVLVRSPLQMEIIGQTIDDAAGEAFDKIAKLLGLEYPGGPMVDKLAKLGNPLSFTFPEPKPLGLNYSFSGIKTSVLYFLQKQNQLNNNFISENINDLCASVQNTIVQYLIKVLTKASHENGVKNIAIAGGVSANSELRKQLQTKAIEQNWQLFIPAFEYCTDNAAMIATAGYYQFLEGKTTGLESVPYARGL